MILFSKFVHTAQYELMRSSFVKTKIYLSVALIVIQFEFEKIHQICSSWNQEEMSFTSTKRFLIPN